MAYTIRRGELSLKDGVEMTFSEEGEAPVNVRSASAAILRDRNWIQYIDDVRVKQSSRRLLANDLQLYMDEANQYVDHLEASSAYSCRSTSKRRRRCRGAGPAGDDEPAEPDEDEEERGAGRGLTSEAGTKRLLTNRLEMQFRERGEQLELVRALEGASS